MQDRLAGIGRDAGGAVERGFNGGRERIHSGAVGTRHALGRHRSDAELAHNFFPDFGVRADVIDIQFVEHQAGRFGFFVVTSDAILID